MSQSRTNTLSTDQSLNILRQHKYRQISELKSNISRTENMLRNQQSLLNQEEKRLEKIIKAQENPDCSYADLLNL